MLQTQVEVFQMKSDRSATEYNALLQSITESTDRLSHLVNDLLSFTNEQEIDLSYPVDQRSLLDETVFELEEAAEAKQIRNQLVEDEMMDQMMMKEYTDPFTGSKNK